MNHLTEYTFETDQPLLGKVLMISKEGATSWFIRRCIFSGRSGDNSRV